MNLPSRRYIVGPARTGKTSRLTARLRQLIELGVRPDRILVLVAQHSATHRFREALQAVNGAGRPRGEPDITTLYGLANRHVGLFCPSLAVSAGFSNPSREPTFINVELAQYLVNELAQEHVAEFAELKLYRPRLLGQILDSMNKAAECGFDLEETTERLGAAWGGDENRSGKIPRKPARSPPDRPEGPSLPTEPSFFRSWRSSSRYALADASLRARAGPDKGNRGSEVFLPDYVSIFE